MTVEGLVYWHPYRVKARNTKKEVIYSDRVIAASAEQAIAGCKAALSNSWFGLDTVDWSVNIAGESVAVVHLV